MKAIAYILVILGAGTFILGGLQMTQAVDTDSWWDSKEVPHHERFDEEVGHCHDIIEAEE